MILFVGKDTTLFRSSSIRYRGWLYRQYDKMSREEMLRQLANYRDHHNAIDGAATGIQFGTDHIRTGEEVNIDFLETDYHD